jgi:hypothetical protein
MDDLIFVSLIFVIGFGCGYCVRDVLSRRRRKRFLEAKQARRSRRQMGLTAGLAGAPSSLRDTPSIVAGPAEDQSAEPPLRGAPR